MTVASPRTRLGAWGHVLRTTNAPAGHDDAVTRWLVITRAAVLPLTIGAGLLSGALAVGQPGFDGRLYLLAFTGIVLAHIANNLMNDIYDARAGSDTLDYPRLMYAPHPTLSGMISLRRLYAATFIVNLLDLAILVALTAARGWPVLASGWPGSS
jgi:1,4-dihydroxy-2-naphthoate octaprenyltransferase